MTEANSLRWVNAKLIPIVSGWTKDRDFPALAPKPFRQIWREELGEE